LALGSSSTEKALAEVPLTEGPINIIVTKPQSKCSSQTGQTTKSRAIEKPMPTQERKLSPKIKSSSRVAKKVIGSKPAKRTPAKKPLRKVFGSDHIMEFQSVLLFPTWEDKITKKAEKELTVDATSCPAKRALDLSRTEFTIASSKRQRTARAGDQSFMQTPTKAVLP
jgi:hypothetical protein